MNANNDGGGSGKPSNPKDQAAETRIPLWLLSGVAMIHWSLAQFAGLLKYGAWNWRIAGVRNSVYISAIKRHIKAYEEGEQCDPVDGTRHLGNIMACAAILMDAEAEGKLIDDRPPASKGYRAAVSEGEALMAKLREQYKDRAPRHWTIADKESSPAPKDVWIPWSGGSCPVPPGTRVACRLREGGEAVYRAETWDWSRDTAESPGDIVAYKVVAE